MRLPSGVPGSVLHDASSALGDQLLHWLFKFGLLQLLG